MHKNIIYIITIIFFVISFLSLAQDKAKVTPELDSLLEKVDENIKQKELKEIILVIDSLKRTKLYKRNKFDRLAIDLRYAKLLYEKDDDEKAMNLLLNGLDKLESYQDSKTIWKYYKTLSFFHRKNKSFPKAFLYNDYGLSNAKSRKDTCDILSSYNSRAKLFFEWTNGQLEDDNILSKNMTDSIKAIGEIIVGYPQNIHCQKTLSIIYTTYATVETVLGNYENATNLIGRSININRKLQDSLGLAFSLAALGSSLYRQNEFIKAIVAYKQSLEYVDGHSIFNTLVVKEASSQNIAWAYSELKDYKLAYEWQNEATMFADSLVEMNRIRDIPAIEAKYFESQRTEIEKNKRLRTQLYFLGFVLLTFIISIIGYIIYNRLLNKQRRTERKISGLKFKALNAQMNPHFINNLLLCIHDLIDKNEKEIAIENLDKFNRLTNLVLRSTKSNMIDLLKEVEMLKLYIDLQLLRFDRKFDFSVNMNTITPEDLNSIKIPPLILQPLVENSIVHGFLNMKEKGRLLLEFKKETDFLICVITDNGKKTSRNLVPEMYTKNGISLKNIGDRLALLSDKKDEENLISFTELKNESNDQIGSKVVLRVPFVYN